MRQESPIKFQNVAPRFPLVKVAIYFIAACCVAYRVVNGRNEGVHHITILFNI
jgi:hypothetical protein